MLRGCIRICMLYQNVNLLGGYFENIRDFIKMKKNMKKELVKYFGFVYKRNIE